MLCLLCASGTPPQPQIFRKPRTWKYHEHCFYWQKCLFLFLFSLLSGIRECLSFGMKHISIRKIIWWYLIQCSSYAVFLLLQEPPFCLSSARRRGKKRQTMCLMPIMVASGTEVGIRPSLSSCWMPLIRWLASALQWAHWKVFDNQWMKAAVVVCCNRTQII